MNSMRFSDLPISGVRMIFGGLVCPDPGGKGYGCVVVATVIDELKNEPSLAFRVFGCTSTAPSAVLMPSDAETRLRFTMTLSSNSFAVPRDSTGVSDVSVFDDVRASVLDQNPCDSGIYSIGAQVSHL